MRKEVSYLIIAVIIALGIVVLYYWGGERGPTAGVIFPEDITNEADCIDANYTWENSTEQNCTDVVNCTLCEEGCETNCTECVDVIIGECIENITLSENDCIDANYTWENSTEQNCTDIPDCIVCEEGCETNCTFCETIVTGGQCVGDVCDSDHLDLCITEEDCEDIGEGYWYNDTCNEDEEEIEEGVGDEEETEEPTPLPVLFTSSTILPLYLNPGNSQESSVTIKNTGETVLSSCVLELMGGELDSWISVSEEIIDINPNQEQAFSFSVTVPEGTAEDSYSLKIATKCSNISQSSNFVVNVVEKKLEFSLISAERIKEEMVKVIYSLEELSGEDQDVEIGFSLLNENNQEVAIASEIQSIGANALQEFSTDIEINESLLPINETTNETMESSELTLVANFNSQIYSSSVMEKITLGAAPIGGFAIFAGVGAGEAIIFVVVLLVLIFIFVFARRMRKRGKTLKDIFKKAPGEGPQ